MEWRSETKQITEALTKGFNYHRDTTLIMGNDVLQMIGKHCYEETKVINNYLKAKLGLRKPIQHRIAVNVNANSRARKIVEQGTLRYRDIFNKYLSPHNSLMYQNKLNNRSN